MAKRGTTRPWRLRFVWGNGVEGVTTFHSQEEADWKAQDMREYAERIGATIVVTITKRKD